MSNKMDFADSSFNVILCRNEKSCLEATQSINLFFSPTICPIIVTLAYIFFFIVHYLHGGGRYVIGM